MKLAALLLMLCLLSGCAVQTVNHGLWCLGVCYDWINERRAVVTPAEAPTQCRAPPGER